MANGDYSCETACVGVSDDAVFANAAQCLAGLPPIYLLGPAIRRMSTALCEARSWKPFNVLLHPALSGIELIKEGGYLTLQLNHSTHSQVHWTRHHVRPTPTKQPQ